MIGSMMLIASAGFLEIGARALEAAADRPDSHRDCQRWLTPTYDNDQDNPLGLSVGMRAPIPHAKASLLGHRIELDRWGIRSPVDIEPKNKSVHPRVLLVGDSVAFGQGLAKEDTPAAQLRKHLKTQCRSEAQVFSIACPGWGLDDIDKATQAGLQHFEVDIVVLLLTLNDLVIDQDQASKARRPWGSEGSALMRLVHRARRALVSRDQALALAEAATPVAVAHLQRLSPNLSRIQTLCDQANVSCVVAISPYANQLGQSIAKDVSVQWGFDMPGDAITRRNPQRALCTSTLGQSQICVDLAESLLDTEATELFQVSPNGRIDYVHPNRRGVQRMMAQLAASLPLSRVQCGAPKPNQPPEN
ncbi:MAG TPA: hypothetical protein DCQ06_00560 [Myxococcales bacterium]|nr:hypothetical protein [Myxococcales bacterium]HAN30063.1 hypothetical protein [Myxococcales bacterium]